ncbi:thioesterase II family protein [Colwelliaceae bacterium MEBiC 14330]
MKNKWFVIPKKNINADLKIICFPYAGGNSSTYISWSEKLPSNVELVIIQAPGRGTRLGETAHSNMDCLINELIKVAPDILDRPYILFGHSLGSRIAFELMDKLKQLNYPLPLHFIASASSGPHKKLTKKSIYHLSDKEFIVELEKLNGTPQAVLKDKELMKLFMPLLRADFEIADNYNYTGNTIFNCPISVLGGEDDMNISHANLNSWGEFFTMNANIYLLPGNHFFIDSHKEMVIEKVNGIIQSTLQKLRLAIDS